MTKYNAITCSIKRSEKTYIHWYDLNSFNQLVQAIHHKDPGRTTKSFCSKFSGAQRVLSGLNFPNLHKKLSDFAEDEEKVKALYNELKEKIKCPSPRILSNLTSGKDKLFRIYGESENHRYKIWYGEYQYSEASVPYVIEGFLLYSKDEYSQSKVITSINNSIPYESCPFYFSGSHSIDFCKDSYYVDSLRSLLDKCGFLGESQGLTLYLNFISPFIEFTDKSKTRIISNRFQEDLIKVVEYLIKDVVKELKRVRRRQKAYDRETAMISRRRESKAELMQRHFMEAYNKASGDRKYLVTARQVFYVIREILNKDYDVELKSSDYGTFTQDHVTAFFSRYPNLEENILFERRGVFKEPFSGEEIPLGTKDVRQYKNQRYKNRIYQEQKTIYSIPPELKYNHVLFIEKQGFNTILEQSGLLRKLNLGIMSTQGFGTRASKGLMLWLLEKDIKVYVLHDCDIPGYLIQDKLKAGSATFRKELNVIEIGLRVEDIDKLGKRHQAEVVQYRKQYSQSLNILTDEEVDFFVVDGYGNKCRRVELNALTTPELIKFIEDKIQYKPIKPGLKELESYIDFNEIEIIKEALYKKYGSGLSVNVSKADIASRIHERLNGQEHWVDTLDSVVKDYIQEKTTEVKKIINEN